MALKFGQALLKESLITREQLKLALERQVIFGGRIGTNIVELGFLKEKELSVFLSKFFRVPAADPSLLSSVDQEVIACISREQAEKYKAIPFKKERNRLHLAMLEPQTIQLVDELRFLTGFDIIPHVIPELRFVHALEKYYGVERDLRYISTTLKDEESEKSPTEDSAERLRKIKEAFTNVHDKEEIIGLLLSETGKIAKRSAVFLIKGDQIAGWKGKGLTVDSFGMNGKTHSVFFDVISRKNYYRGPLLKIPGNEPLMKLLGGSPQDAIVIPIQIREKIIGILFADNGNTSVLDASINRINTLVSMASLAFELIIIKKKILDL